MEEWVGGTGQKETGIDLIQHVISMYKILKQEKITWEIY